MTFACEQIVDEPKRRDGLLERGERLLPREDRGEVLRSVGALNCFEPGYLQAHDPLVKEEERAQRLVPHGGCGAARQRTLA